MLSGSTCTLEFAPSTSTRLQSSSAGTSLLLSAGVPQRSVDSFNAPYTLRVGGQVRLDPAEFDRVLANVRAEALEEAADAMDADASVHDPLRLKSDWIRIRAAQLRQETETR
ncbi:hypothetical protein ATC04_00015 [Arthrobacter sp. YC-RL1]|nr:hypothetical protein ATC04_00015 [Arthrobacter sp. YC-RL1]